MIVVIMGNSLVQPLSSGIGNHRKEKEESIFRIRWKPRRRIIFESDGEVTDAGAPAPGDAVESGVEDERFLNLVLRLNHKRLIIASSCSTAHAFARRFIGVS